MMSKYINLGRLIVLVAFGLIVSKAEARSINWQSSGHWLSWSDAQSLAKTTKKPILLFVYSKQCGHCYKISSLLRSTRMRRITSRFLKVRYNADNPTPWYQKLKPHVGMYYPKFLLFDHKQRFLKKVTTGRRSLPYSYNYEKPRLLFTHLLQVSCRANIRGACNELAKLKTNWKKADKKENAEQRLRKQRRKEKLLRQKAKRKVAHLTPSIVKLYTMSCRTRNKPHCWELMLWYFSREDDDAIRKAIRIGRRACFRLKWSKACLKLGDMYRKTTFVRQNYKMARLAFRQACHLQNGKGCATVGLFYAKGWGGVYKQCKMALQWYQRACRLGYKKACLTGCP